MGTIWYFHARVLWGQESVISGNENLGVGAGYLGDEQVSGKPRDRQVFLPPLFWSQCYGSGGQSISKDPASAVGVCEGSWGAMWGLE